MRYAIVVPAILAVSATAAPLPSPVDVVDDTLDALTGAVDSKPVTTSKEQITAALDGALEAKRDTKGFNDGVDLSLSVNDILQRDSENAMDGIDAAVDASVDLRKRSEDLTVGGLSVHNLDVPPNLNIQNIPRSEDVEIDSVGLPAGVPTLTILRRGDGDGNGEVVSDNNGLLGLGVLGLKRDNEILSHNLDNGVLGGIGISVKRNDAPLADDDEAEKKGLLGLGILDLVKRNDAVLTDADETTNNGKGVLGLGLAGLKRDNDDNILIGDTSSLAGITLPIKRDTTTNEQNDDSKPVDIALKRDPSDILGLDLDQIGDNSVPGYLNIKREEDSSVGGVGGFDVGTPILDIVNL